MARINKNPDIRKSELLDIGVALYLSGGMRKVSVNKVVSAAGVATGLFYYYFKTKEEFIAACIERFITQFTEKIIMIMNDNQTTYKDRLETLISKIISQYCKARPVLNDEFLHTPEHLALEGAIMQQLMQPCTRFLYEGKEAGVFHIGNPNTTAQFLIGGLSGILGLSSADDSNQLEEIENLVYRLLYREV